MTIDEINYKGCRIDVLHQGEGWKALVYRPSSPLHEVTVPDGPNRRSVIEEAKMLADKFLEA
jgi:hypothetical protein